MKPIRGLALLSLFGIVSATVAHAQETVSEAIPNWPAPATWSPHSASRGVSTMGAVTSPFPFVGLAPCRIVDTRGGAPITGGIFTGGSDVRSYATNGICGIPLSARALSLNFTITNPGQTVPGFLTAWPTGGAVPPVSILNWDHVPAQIANAAVVPTGPNASITVNVSAPTHVIIDVNGYYGPGVGQSNTFLGFIAGNFTLTGNGDTGIGAGALQFETSGSLNTALGWSALGTNSTGSLNTAIGVQVLEGNTAGSSNTAVGYAALKGTNGDNNVAIGAGALQNNGGGSNIALGTGAGINLTSGGFNMYLGNEGVASESTTIRIGSGLSHTRLFVAGVLTSAVTGTPVLISGTGQLGVATSSARYKEEIQDMGDASDRLAKLRPVTFRYKGHADDPTQFGLIAEEVEKVLPELVFHSASGQPETVLYNEMPAMLLNEIQKQQKRIDRQAQEIARLLDRVQTLEGRLSEVSAK